MYIHIHIHIELWPGLGFEQAEAASGQAKAGPEQHLEAGCYFP